MSLSKQYLKSKPTCKVTFRVPAAERVRDAGSVALVGDFNGWHPDAGIMTPLKNGDFKCVLELEAGKAYEFRYLVDDAIWENDTDADRYLPNAFGAENSVVVC